MQSVFTVTSPEDISLYERRIRDHSAHTFGTVKSLFDQDPIAFLARMKFGAMGKHPIEDRSINFIEQLNQTFTYLTALEATKLIFEWHPDCGGLTLAPGAYAPKKENGDVRLDIESLKPNYIGAETFSAATPKSNRKIHKDLDKLANRTELHRYVFFSSPKHPETQRQLDLEKNGVHVWSVNLEATAR